MADLSKVKIVKLETGSKYQRLFSQDSGTCGIKAGHVILKEKEEVGEHSTGSMEEALIILKGKGELIVNKKRGLNFKENMVLYVPPETIHNVKNTGTEPLEYIFITSNANQKL